MNGKRLGEQPAYARPASLDNSGSSHEDGDRHVAETEGLSKREAFAMAAMQGFCATDQALKADPDDVAKVAIGYADALLNQLAKGD